MYVERELLRSGGQARKETYYLYLSGVAKKKKSHEFFFPLAQPRVLHKFIAVISTTVVAGERRREN